MIKQISKTAFILCVTLLTFSCGSDDDGGSGDSGAAFSVAVNGDNFSTETVTAILTNDGKNLTIIATDVSSMESVTLRVGSLDSDAPLVAAGSFTVTEESTASVGYLVDGNSFLALQDGSGTIVITDFDADDNEVSGTFVATVSNTQIGGDGTFELTSGSFNNISFTVQ